MTSTYIDKFCPPILSIQYIRPPTKLFISLVPRPLPDFISQLWGKIDFSPQLSMRSNVGVAWERGQFFITCSMEEDSFLSLTSLPYCKQQKAGQGPGNKANLALFSLNIPHIHHASLLLTLVSQPHSLPGGKVPHCGDCWGDRQRQDHPGQRRKRQSLALCCESTFTQPSTPVSYLHNGVTRSFHRLIQETNLLRKVLKIFHFQWHL